MIGGLAETGTCSASTRSTASGPKWRFVDAREIGTAYRRLCEGDVRYRFVIDGTTIGK
ncbi:hypothetical protein EV578_115120 [Streptomyces sp. BK205]|nr:hypothetical protein EV578_115120 [Streptomyces sp. BK205]